MVRARPMGVASRLTGLVIVIVTLLLPGVEPGKFKYVVDKDFLYNLIKIIFQ